MNSSKDVTVVSICVLTAMKLTGRKWSLAEVEAVNVLSNSTKAAAAAAPKQQQQQQQQQGRTMLVNICAASGCTSQKLSTKDSPRIS